MEPDKSEEANSERERKRQQAINGWTPADRHREVEEARRQQTREIVQRQQEARQELQREMSRRRNEDRRRAESQAHQRRRDNQAEADEQQRREDRALQAAQEQQHRGMNAPQAQDTESYRTKNSSGGDTRNVQLRLPVNT